MQLNGFPQNAECDMHSGAPKEFEAAGGFVTIRFNVEPKTETPEEGGEPVQVGYKYSEIHFAHDAHKDIKGEAKRRIINTMYDHDDEEALKHQADAVATKIVSDPQAKARYNAFLQFRADIDTMLNELVIE